MRADADAASASQVALPSQRTQRLVDRRRPNVEMPRECLGAPAGGRRVDEAVEDLPLAVPIDAASNHCRSSIATTAARCPASACKTSRTAIAIARGSTASDAASSRRSAASSARRRGADSCGRTSSSTSSNRSPSPTCARPRSASAGRDASTQRPCSRAAATAARQSIDFPIPGSPSSTSPTTRSAGASRST